MVITWAVVTVFGQRSKVLLLFVAHQFSALSVVLTLFGVWRMFAPDDLVHLGSRLASFSIPLSVLVSVWFHSRLLADLGARATHTKIIGISAALPVFGMLLIAAGFPQIGLMLSHATIAAVMPFSVFVALRLRADAGRWWWRPSIAAAYLVMSILMAPAWLRVLGLLPGGAWTFFSPLVYAVVSAILMAALIVVRARELRRLGLQNEAAFLRAAIDDRPHVLYGIERPRPNSGLLTRLAKRQAHHGERGLEFMGEHGDQVALLRCTGSLQVGFPLRGR